MGSRRPWLALVVAGCFGGEGGGGGGSRPDAAEGDAPFWDGAAPIRSVHALRAAGLPPGNFVQLDPVVVTAVRGDDVFIADPLEVIDADRDLGLLLRAPRDLAGEPHVFGPVMAMGSIEVVEGDLVGVDGVLAEETLPGASAPTLVLTDAVVLPATGRAPTRVPTIARTDLAATGALASVESMVVKVRDVPIGGAPAPSGSVPIFGGGAIDTTTTTTGFLMQGSCLASVAGAVVYGPRNLLLPRRASDVDGTPASSCPPFTYEYHTAECSDGLDNDWDERTDCEGGGCEMACACLEGTAVAATVSAIQTPASPPSGYLKLAGAVVTAVNRRIQGGDYWELWVTDPSATTSANGGIRLLYPRWTHDLSGLDPGETVTAVGLARAYTLSYGGSSTELRRLEYTLVEPLGLGTVPTPATLTATQLASGGAPWDGQLVRVSQHRLTSGFDPGGFGLLSDGTSTILLSRRLTDLTTVPGTCYASVTGIIVGECGDRPATNPCVVLAPRDAADVVEGGTACP